MAKSIMIQGTMSNAGKSLFAAGLCRVLAQDGYKVAPFKSQNMALNSYITADGYEMGRAQVMQAEAAGIAPDVNMNPILLKPTNDTGSQVILQGVVQGNMRAMDYYKHKKDYIPAILESYHRLEEQYDIIVIEGAGSPAEINLKENDIVNMGMAKMANAPVLLVGDIDRGGVFAQLVGTMILLEPEEQAYVKGMIINKFRGDVKILEPGLDMLEEKCHKTVLGVVPYLYVDIDDEDSLTERFDRKEAGGLVDIAVIRFPRISNFTDVNVFSYYEGVTVRYVSNPSELGNPDMIILPGSKNTIEDLLWMRQNGLEARIKQLAEKETIVFGICGGYQMLGKRIMDDTGVEHLGSVTGMELLPIETIFMQEKTRTRVNGTFAQVDGALSALSGMTVEGYEIHMGTSKGVSEDSAETKEFVRLYLNNANDICKNTHMVQCTKDSKEIAIKNPEISQCHENEQKITNDTDNGNLQKCVTKSDGAQSGNVYGSYLHGIFDAPEVAKTVITAILQKKGINAEQIGTIDVQSYKEQQYDKLADAIRASVDMKQIYEIIEQGITTQNRSEHL